MRQRAAMFIFLSPTSSGRDNLNLGCIESTGVKPSDFRSQQVIALSDAFKRIDQLDNLSNSSYREEVSVRH